MNKGIIFMNEAQTNNRFRGGQLRIQPNLMDLAQLTGGNNDQTSRDPVRLRIRNKLSPGLTQVQQEAVNEMREIISADIHEEMNKIPLIKDNPVTLN
mmetsp:Transcript_28465/g.25307  ORF Transcript_28465/g.25307 Transcript_28465/m.25307 type:complete len:97 (+) Transcript_28465:648-938(+)